MTSRPCLPALVSIASSMFALSACMGDGAIGTLEEPANSGDSGVVHDDAAETRAPPPPPASTPPPPSVMMDSGFDPPDLGMEDPGHWDSGVAPEPPDGGTAPDLGVPVDPPDSGSSGGGQPFGGTCTIDADCQMGFVCRAFGQLGNVCTKSCSANNQCPAGSQGQRCNQMGYCRP